MWKDASGYEGYYEISESGDVRRSARAQGATVGRLLRWRVGYGGYPVVVLTCCAASRKHYVHRLVAATFLGPCSPRMEVNHKDRNRTNPAADNLEYLTRGDNIRHSLANGARRLSGEQKPTHKLTWSVVQAIRISKLSHRILAKQYGVCHTTIGNIKRGTRWAGPEIEKVLA